MGATLLICSALVGAGLHACSQLRELDLALPQTLFSLGAVAFAAIYAGVYSTATNAAISLSITTLSLTVCTLVYRAFFHRLRKFPGPFPAKLTKFYGVWLSRNNQYHFEVEKLHEKYGDVLRTGPRELTISRASPLLQISACGKTNFYSMHDSNLMRLGLASTTSIDDHRKRRRGWNIPLTPQQISIYDDSIHSVVSIFLERIAETAGKPTNITEWNSWLSYDIMGIVGYGKDFGNLRNNKEHNAIKLLRESVAVLGFFKQVPWLGNLLVHIPGGLGALEPFTKYCKDLVTEKQQLIRGKSLDSPTDIVTWFIKSFEEKKNYAAHTIEGLHDDSRSLVVGGSDTTSATMTNILYYLSLHPHYMKKLQSELDSVFPNGPSTFTSNKLDHSLFDRVPLLEGIINETLRLNPPVSSGNPRVTPPEGIHVPTQGGEEAMYIPGDVNVLMPQWIFPFQLGMYNCVGKDLGMWEMKIVLSRLALQFDVCFAPEEDGKFQERILDTWTLTLPSLNLVFTERKAAE
ncbi:uncharacterized protein K452DRAFT_249623, partial [Aplosporella prunicola CBS 121167]